MRRPLRLSAVVLFSVLASGSLTAQRRLSPELLKAAPTGENATRWLDSFRSVANKPALLAIAVNGQASLPGMRRIRSLGGNYQLVYFEPGAAKGVDLPPIEAAVLITPEMKLAAELQQAPAGPVEVMIATLPETPEAQIRAVVESAGGKLLSGPLNALGYYEAVLSATALRSVAGNPIVLHIGPKAVDKPLNLESKRTTKTNLVVAPRSAGGWDLQGDSITVGVGDNVPGLFHVDLRDRVINYNPQPYANHGQHVSGTVAGAGIMDPKGEGFATHSTVVNHFFNLVWQNTAAMRSAHNMRITNNSYANVVGNCAAAGRYDVYSQILDTMSLTLPDVLHVFASGNDGGATCSPFQTGYSTVTGGYQTAKNVLVVGNATKINDANPGTSRGPIRDGRLKPEIAAVGSSTWSTRSNDTYNSASGTSMACPEVAGMAALLQQRYKQTHGGAYPASALAKALLMNGALDIGRPGPDFEFGFGMADLTRSLRAMDSNYFTTGAVSNGATQNPVNIVVPAGTGQLKVMLYWHDVPASILSGTQLINDLDLRVTTPSSTQVLPLVLDPNPANVTANAVQGSDRLNNVEQVVINNPSPGSYAVNVNGYSVPQGPQAYTIVYDIIPTGIELTCPLGGEAFKAGEPIVVTWNASPGANTFTVEASTDNGATWTTLSSTVPATDRIHFWQPATPINSGQCRVRVSRNGTSEQFSSGNFCFNIQPQLRLSAVQCPGYAALNWSPVPNATGYTVFRKIGPQLQAVSSQTDTLFTASGLRSDSLYYFAVAPVFGTQRGYRSMGLSYVPNSGSCGGAISDNDLRLDAILSPVSGRQNTSSALSAGENLQIAVRNLDDAAIGLYQVAYQINGGAWTTQTISGIGAGANATVSFPGLDFSAPGIYVIRAAVTNLSATDPVRANDTVTRTLRQLLNAPVVLATGFSDDFETLDRTELRADSMGFTANQRWDFTNSHDTGRLRSFIDSTITIGGTRSISLDMERNMYPSLNRLTGTFNLAGVAAGSTEVRIEFDYKIHGRSRGVDSNRVWVRGADTQPWIPVFTYSRSAIPGVVYPSSSLSISDALFAAGQSFSSSTQVAFGQFDTAVIAHNEYGNGLTVDNFKLYQVSNDAGITAVLSPNRISCGLGTATPLTVTVENGVTATMSNVYLYYQLDGGTIYKDSILSLPGKTTVPFTFAQRFDASAPGSHTLKVWVQAPGDSYPENDTVLNFSFRNQPLVASFPYLQDFEGSDGFWFAEGLNSSWEYGTPASPKIRKAASGSKAWKTSLTGNYNDNERSYLYGPCFSTGSLTTPMLSFSMASEIEDCGAGYLCDGAWVEWSTNDTVWTKLGAVGQGTNWYTNPGLNVWSSQTNLRWKVASIPLPTGITQPMRIRFVMFADPGGSFEGLAIDDVHVYDRTNPIYAGGAAGPLSQSVGGGGSTQFNSGGAVLAQLNPGTAGLGTTNLTVYTHSSIINASSSQYFLPRNFVINTQNTPSDSVVTRLYVPDADVLTLVNATGCGHCAKPADAYELGVTKYDNPNPAVENDNLSDNIGGQYVFIPASRVRWVPYDAGYYAEFKVNSFSEFWFNSGGPGGVFPLPVASLDFAARKISETSVLTSWLSYIDTQVSSYELQRSDNGVDFRTIARRAPQLNVQHEYTYTDLVGQVNVKALYYRLQYTLRDGKTYYSQTRQVIWSGRNADITVSPNPTADGRVQLDWSTQPGQELQVQISDVTGRVIRSYTERASTYLNRSSLDLGPEPKGIYMLRASLGGENFAFKVTRL